MDIAELLLPCVSNSYQSKIVMVSEEYNILFAGINFWIIFLYPINNQLNRISSFMTYHQILIHKVKTTDPTIGAGTVQCTVDHCLSCCPLPYGHYIVCSSIYGF